MAEKKGTARKGTKRTASPAKKTAGESFQNILRSMIAQLPQIIIAGM